MTDDNQAILSETIVKLDKVIADLTEATRQAKTARQKARIAEALRKVVAIREVIKPPPPE